ncbi:hypothetical protein GCM10010442_00010 [Kitasatospora kifunensis]
MPTVTRWHREVGAADGHPLDPCHHPRGDTSPRPSRSPHDGSAEGGGPEIAVPAEIVWQARAAFGHTECLA